VSGNDRLALFGGDPVVEDHTRLRIEWPPVDREDLLALEGVIRRREFSGRDSPEVRCLEQEMSDVFAPMIATALNSGSSALHCALAALEILPGEEVIVPSLTFVACALAVVHNHSIPVFADIDPVTYNITWNEIRKVVTPRTRAVIVPHMHGFPADIDEITSQCHRRGLKVIEDVAQAPGARVNGELVGTIGDVAAFSFMSQKNIGTCGECGVLLTRTLAQRNRAEMLRIYGEIIRTGQSRLYNSFTMGWNYTLNPLQAAMARVRLGRMEEVTAQIRLAGRRLTAGLLQFPWLRPPLERQRHEAVFHFIRVWLDCRYVGYSDAGRFRQAIQDALAAEGLNTRLYQNVPLPGHPVFQTRNALGGGVPWSCADSVINYRLTDYPHALDTIRRTLILGSIGSAPAYLLCEGTVDRYIEGFRKVDKNLDQIISYAKGLRYQEPWELSPMTSDSYGVQYDMIDAHPRGVSDGRASLRECGQLGTKNVV